MRIVTVLLQGDDALLGRSRTSPRRVRHRHLFSLSDFPLLTSEYIRVYVE